MPSDSPESAPIRLDHLLALNDEIAALTRAGLPLDLGLSQLSGSAPAALSRISGRLAERVASGDSLQAAIDAEGDRLPAVYRAVVEAGLRAGRLPEALESMSSIARNLIQLRNRMFEALTYPVLVLISAWLLLVGLSVYVVPRYFYLWNDFGMEYPTAMTVMRVIGNNVAIWGPLPFVVLIAVCIFTRYFGDNPANRLFPGRLQLLNWWPGLLTNFEYVTFLRMLRLLMQHEAPLHEAVVLAGHSTGGQNTAEASAWLGDQLRSGQTLQQCAESATAFPQFIRWILAAAGSHQAFPETLNLAADVYYQRALRQTEFIRVMLPIILLVLVGAPIVLLYCIMLFSPAIQLLNALS